MKSEPIDCASVLEQLLERDEGAPASPERAAACAAHLERCGACREQAERLGLALAALRTRAADPVPSIDVWGGVRAALAAEGRLAEATASSTSVGTTKEPTPAAVRPVRRNPSILRRAGAFAAAAAAVVLFWTLRDSSSTPAGTDVPAAPVAAQTESRLATPQPALVASPAVETLGSVRTLPLAGAPELQPIPTSAGTAGGLRRATGEERRRDFSVPFESATGSSGWSLASDRELR